MAWGPWGLAKHAVGLVRLLGHKALRSVTLCSFFMTKLTPDDQQKLYF